MFLAGPVTASNLPTDIDALGGSLATRVYRSLKASIMSLELAPGEIIRKNTICEKLGVSRSPVSDAIARLATEGLVQVVPQSGTYVTKFSMKEIREGAFLREAIEVAAVGKVTKERSEEQLTQLNRNLRFQILLVEDEDFAGFYKADEDMHELIMGFTGYIKLAKVAGTARLQVNRARRLVLPSPGRVQETIEEHQRIIEAIRNQDPGMARNAMVTHLGQLIKWLEPLERQRPELFQ